MIRIPVPSVLNRLNGSSRATRHLLIRARSASGQVARGGHVTRSGSQPRVCRRPARTFVLPTPRVPDGLTITRFAEEAADTKAPKSSCPIMEFASASIAPSSMSSIDRVPQKDLPQYRRAAGRSGCMVSRVQLSATTSRPLVLRQDPDADLSRYTTTGKGKTHGAMTTGDSHMGFKTASTVCPIKSQLIHLGRPL